MSSGGVDTKAPRILIVGASRGLGLGLAAEFLKRDWNVVATVRGDEPTALHTLAGTYSNRLQVELLDLDDPRSIGALRDRLTSHQLDMLFINAGTTTNVQDAPVGDVATDEFFRLMNTNVLGPMRVIEALQHLVPADGLIGAMSSGQGSVANNESGRREVYRASKAALNMSMRSFAAREGEPLRAMLLLAPGWIRTELAGPNAPFTLEESIPVLAEVMLAKRKRPGLEFLDRFGQTVPW